MTPSNKDKSSLRALLRERRRAIGNAERSAASSKACRHLSTLPDWPRRRRIALYLPADGEFDPAAIIDHCRESGREIYLPRVLPGRRLQFALWRNDIALQGNRYGIDEPPASAPACPVAALDVLFLPLVGWDRAGNRLGMGGGYYDCSLAQERPGLVVGLGFASQEIDELPTEPWDVTMDYVLCEQGLHRCCGAGG